MKRIKRYTEYNEGVKLSHVIIALGLTIFGIKTFNMSKIKDSVEMVNNKDYDYIRKMVIESVESNNKIDQKTRKELIDSLEKVIIYKGVDLKGRYGFFSVGPRQTFISINEDTEDHMIESVVYHEMNQY